MIKHFIYCECQDGGMGAQYFTCSIDFQPVYGWMKENCAAEDTALLNWIEGAQVGDHHEHRLGVAIRLKDA